MFLSYKKLNQIKMQRKKDLDKFNNDLQSTKQQFDNKLENYQGIIKQQVKLVLPFQVSSLIFFLQASTIEQYCKTQQELQQQVGNLVNQVNNRPKEQVPLICSVM